MNVAELKAALSGYPDDMEVIYQARSDFHSLCKLDLEVVEAVDKGFYVMRIHRTMSDENKSKIKKYLLFPGN